MPIAAQRLVEQELAVEGIPERNLATFVTTWMEPEARRVIDGNLHRNFIDHEYPRTFEIRALHPDAGGLFHAPGETTGTSTQGSSEAIMLGALSLKWMAPAPRGGRQVDREAEPRLRRRRARGVGEVLPLLRRRAANRSVAAEVHGRPRGRRACIDENTIGVAAVVGTTFTGHADDVVGINELLVGLRDEQGLDVPLHIDGASGAFVWPFCAGRSGTSVSSRCARSMRRGTSSASSIPESAG